MPNVMGDAMKLAKLIFTPRVIMGANSHRTPVHKDAMTRGLVDARRRMTTTATRTPKRDTMLERRPSLRTDSRMSALGGSAPATRGGVAPAGADEADVARSAST